MISIGHICWRMSWKQADARAVTHKYQQTYGDPDPQLAESPIRIVTVTLSWGMLRGSHRRAKDRWDSDERVQHYSDETDSPWQIVQ